MGFCTRCGRPADPGTQFCTGCGARISPPAPPAPPPDHKPAPPPAAPPRPPRNAPPRRGVPRWAIITGVPVVLAICGAVIALIVIRSSPASHVASGADTSAASSPSAPAPQLTTQTTTQPLTTGSPAEQVAAQDLSRMLAQSASDHSAIVAAYNDVGACGSHLTGDAQTFQQAAGHRRSGTSPSSPRAAIPPGRPAAAPPGAETCRPSPGPALPAERRPSARRRAAAPGSGSRQSVV